MITVYTVALTVACCIALAVVLSTDKGSRSADAGWLRMQSLAVLAACAATLSTLSYAMSGSDFDLIVPLVIADVTMPLALGLMVATIRRAAGKGRTFIAPIALLAVGVGAITFFVSPDAGTFAKLVVLTFLSAVIALTCARATTLPLAARWLVGGSAGVYGLYCLVRLSAMAIAGADSALVLDTLGAATSTIVAAAAVAATTIGVILILRSSGDAQPSQVVGADALTDWIDALMSQGSAFTTIATSVPDLTLHRAAFGRAWALAITDALTRATVATMPDGSVIGRAAPKVLVTIQFGSGLDLEAIGTRLQAAYERALPRWAPTEPPDLLVERLDIKDPADLHRFARRSRAAARRVTAFQAR
ncbi:hypothetical protein [Microbacterium rhizomatis]|uniref:hypothetical protein n=1 Tax=Microbacterium rhizomatis TaxID=1631477 RepID=UPI0014794E37|nr:hypothetical protein [Microbacterium rhizomatis]